MYTCSHCSARVVHFKRLWSRAEASGILRSYAVPTLHRDLSRLAVAAEKGDDKALQGLGSRALIDGHSSVLTLPLSQIAHRFQGNARIGDREWTIEVRDGSLFCDLIELRSIRKL